MTEFARAFIASLEPEDVDALAGLLRPLITVEHTDQPQWMTVTEAADHLRCPTSRVYALTSARRIPFHKDGSRTLFHRGELDAWIRDGGATRP